MSTDPIFGEIEDLPGNSVGRENVSNFRYADDTTVIADTEERLQEIMNVVIERSEELGVSMNVSKQKR